MKRIAAVSLTLLALSGGWLIFISQPSVAQTPSGEPSFMLAQAGDPFGTDPNNVVPLDSPLRENNPGNPNNLVPPGSPLRGGAQPVPPPVTEPIRDPTTVAPDIRNILDPPEENISQEVVPLPRLSGRVSLPGGATMAVITIGEEHTVVSEGDKLNFSFGNRGLETMEILSLTPTKVEVKLEQLGRTVSLR